MRTLNRNKQTLYYSLNLGKQPKYKTDDNGNLILKNGNPIKTGEYEVIYADPIEFQSSISFSGGEAKVVEYGVDFSSYDATLVLPKDTEPIKELALIWHTSEIKYDDSGKIDPLSADYQVKRKSPSLNYDKFLLERIIKNEKD